MVGKKFEWKGKMTAKAAWKLGYITREEYLKIRREGKKNRKPTAR